MASTSTVPVNKMTTSEAIDVVVSRNSRPHEDDWELLEAAEVLASTVAKLRCSIQVLHEIVETLTK